jgi:hypothetical protein
LVEHWARGHLRPKPGEANYSLEQFLSQGRSVLVGWPEYLITNNNFLTVLRFVQSLRTRGHQQLHNLMC